MSSPIRVLQVVPEMAYGGVEKIVLNYYEQLDHEKYVFDFLGHGTPEEYHQKLTKQGSKFFYLKTMGALGYGGYKNQIAKSIDLTEYDVVHVHIGHITGLYASVFKSLGAKKIICHAHTTKCINKKHQLFMPIFRLLARAYGDIFLACGNEAGKFCFGKTDFEVLPNGVNFELYKKISPMEIEETKKELGILPNDFVIGHVGRFSAEKNHAFIIDVMNEYSKINENAKLVLVGEGPLKNEIKSLLPEKIKSKVIFAGVRNDVPALMKLFDVFVLPSFHEGLPVVSVEAQAAGTPCLISEGVKDKSLDIGASPVKFLPINNGCAQWVSALVKLNKNNAPRPDTDTIYNALYKSGYVVAASVNKLIKVYDLFTEDTNDRL